MQATEYEMLPGKMFALNTKFVVKAGFCHLHMRKAAYQTSKCKHSLNNNMCKKVKQFVCRTGSNFHWNLIF